MTPNHAVETLLMWLRSQQGRYLAPTVLEPENQHWPTLLFPVVEAFDERTGNTIIFTCVTHRKHVEAALKWAADFAEWLGSYYGDEDEPLDVDYAVWYGEVIRP
jgi:hypothetical protein